MFCRRGPNDAPSRSRPPLLGGRRLPGSRQAGGPAAHQRPGRHLPGARGGGPAARGHRPTADRQRPFALPLETPLAPLAPWVPLAPLVKLPRVAEALPGLRGSSPAATRPAPAQGYPPLERKRGRLVGGQCRPPRSNRLRSGSGWPPEAIQEKHGGADDAETSHHLRVIVLAATLAEQEVPRVMAHEMGHAWCGHDRLGNAPRGWCMANSATGPAVGLHGDWGGSRLASLAVGLLLPLPDPSSSCCCCCHRAIRGGSGYVAFFP